MKLAKRYYFYIPIAARVTWYLTRKQLIAELDTREAPKLRKFGNLSIGGNLHGYDVSVRANADRTDLGEGGRESGVSSSREEYVVAEVKFCVSSTPFVSAVSHMATRTF